MKMNLKNNVIIKQSLCWIAAFACVFLALGIMSYVKTNREYALLIHDQALSERMRDVAEQNKLIRLIGSGKTAEARKLLNEQLSYNLGQVEALAPTATESAKGFAKVLSTEIARDERTHPDYYLTTTKHSLANASLVQMVRH